jgi:glucose-1-phosphate cytidylyltransferase
MHDPGSADATMTVVRPHSQWGVAVIGADERITGFEEKPRLEHWINGGFFVCEPAFLDAVDEDSVLEREPLERLASAGRLAAYRHDGFWECMDTYKDAVTLNDLWGSGRAPWAVWDREGVGAGARRWSPVAAGSSAPGLPRRCSSAATRSSRLTGAVAASARPRSGCSASRTT